MAIDKTTITNQYDLNQHIIGNVVRTDYAFFNNIPGVSSPENKSDVEQIGGTAQELTKGSKPPIVKVTNNPTLQRPTVAGMKYFGQSPVFKMAVDQLINRAVGIFPTGSHGSGSNAFHFTSSGLFGGTQNLTSIMAQVVGGTNAAGSMTSLLTNAFTALAKGQDPTTFLTDNLTKYVYNATTQVSSLLGANALSTIDLTKPDEVVQLIYGVSSFFGGSSGGFDTTTISKGVTYATDVANYIKSQK